MKTVDLAAQFMFWNRCVAAGLAPCDPSALAVFRIALGLSVAWFAFSTLTTGSLQADYIGPPIHLTFYGFDWVRPWPGEWMTIHFLVLLVSALGFALGLCYRISAVVTLYCFTHVFLIERSIYNNHYYLVALLALLANFMPLHAGWSLDALRVEPHKLPMPQVWQLWLLRFQISAVYIFGGIAKLDADWLAGQPMRMWLAAKSNLLVIGPYVYQEWLVQFFAWGGLFIDLLAAPCLLWRPTRPLMFLILAAFHLINSQLFTIGFFPWLMLPASALLFSPSWPKRWLRLPVPEAPSPVKAEWPLQRQLATALIAVYVAWQCLFPMRHLLYPGNASWTEQGQLFAWRMMLRQKTTAVRFYGRDQQTNREGVIDIRPFLNQRQLAMMSRDPDLIVQFAQKLASIHARHGTPDLEIRAKILASLNGRRPQLLIDPTVDLTRLSRQGIQRTWVLPLTEPYRHDAWNVPVSQWERILEQDPQRTQSLSRPPAALSAIGP